MANQYTATQLLLSLKARALLPSNDETFSSTDFLRFVNEEVQTYIVPMLLSVREDFFTTSTDITIVANTAEYDIPERAVGSVLRGVSILSGSTYVPIPRVELEALYQQEITGTPNGYYLRSNKVALSPTPTGAGTLRLHYFLRPNRVVATSDVGQISSISSNTITVSSIPSTFVTSSASNGILYDLVKGKAMFDCLSTDLSGTVSGSTITFSAVPSTCAVGDFVCLAQETPIPQIPVELHPLLSERVTTTVLKALGDQKATYAVAEQMEKKMLEILRPRVVGSPRYVVNRNGVGWIGRSRNGFNWGV